MQPHQFGLEIVFNLLFKTAPAWNRNLVMVNTSFQQLKVQPNQNGIKKSGQNWPLFVFNDYSIPCFDG